ncbi:uncharacterized protein C6orf132 homolog isoform X1 [Hippocampus zosterae]|uniref:uncharacterized protein C6orf132 homolog isoform X1 n=2 Tax=Hippocampus zosterae TaxID=109293 RepID=UPI00223D5CBB|nr:uncharacterized protein C6orf132 homolog isoform X1 [Hippocampus zosterae]
MKRGTLAFLGRKDQSLFDTSIKMREMDNVDLVLNSPTSSESGIASVRARPTVKHYTSSESFQGFAVPTPRVPVLPTISGPKINGAMNGERLSYGLEEEILVPPPPSMAPPPPPETFILPPPDFMGYLSNLEMAAVQPPPTVAPKPPKEEKNRRITKSQPMTPPKPPSTGSNSSASSTPISKPSPAKVPKHPNFAPPPPPGKEHQKTHKTPPPKPIRLSSMANLDSPPQNPAPPPPVQNRTQSTFNPQNTAKLNNVSNTSILKGYVEQDSRPKQMLLLEDSGSTSPVQMLVPVNGNIPKQTPTKPIRKDPLNHKDNLQTIPTKPIRQDALHHKENLQTAQLSPTKPIRKDPLHHKENFQSTHLSQAPLHEPPKSIPSDGLYHKENTQSIPPSRLPLPEVNTKAEPVTMSVQNETVKPLRVPYQIPRKLQTGNKTLLTSEDIQGKHGPKPPAGKSDPLVGHKLHNSGESSAAQEAPAASPFSLLMAAKERDKNKSFQSHEIGNMNNDQRRESFQKINSTTPQTLPPMSRALSSSSLLHQDHVQPSPTPVSPVQFWETKSATIPRISDGPTYSLTESSSTDMSNQLVQRNDSYIKSGGNKEHLSMLLLPPPPEFEDCQSVTESPVSTSPPNTFSRMTSQTSLNSIPLGQIPPSLVPKTSKHQSLNAGVQLRPQFQTNSMVNLAQPPTPLSPSQSTLVSILQRKMLEMDHKMTATNEADHNAEEWSVPLSEDVRVPVIPKSTSQAKSVSIVTNQTPTHHKQDGKAVRKFPDVNSNELQSSHQYGMTYRIRPGSKQPITLIRKGAS